MGSFMMVRVMSCSSPRLSDHAATYQAFRRYPPPIRSRCAFAPTPSGLVDRIIVCPVLADPHWGQHDLQGSFRFYRLSEDGSRVLSAAARRCVILTAPSRRRQGKQAPPPSWRRCTLPSRRPGRRPPRQLHQGFMKVLVGENDDRIVGFTMIGSEAGEVMAI